MTMKKPIAALLAVVAVATVVAVGAAQQGKPSTKPATSATQAYQSLTAEITKLNQQAMQERSQDRQLAIVHQVVGKLEDFRKSYPGTPEALDAGLQLGVLDFNLQQFPDAVERLSEYVVNGSDRQKLAFAHYYLAESYKNLSKLDDAQKEYQVIIDQYKDINPRLLEAAKTSLSDLGTQRRLAVGSEPIPFEVTGLKGEKLSPKKYKGKVLLIDFWATWCGPCKMEMPNVKRLYDKYNGQGFEIVGISLDRSRDALENYIKQNKIEWPQYFDGKYWNNQIAIEYAVRAIPTTFLIDKKGKIRYKSLRGKQLEDAVQKLLKEHA